MGIIDQWNEEVEKVKCEICDEYCRFPREIKDEQELFDKCEKCPFGRL